MNGRGRMRELMDDYRGHIFRAILRSEGQELVIDMDWAGTTYTLKLRRDPTGDCFSGQWSSLRTAESGAVSATLYRPIEIDLLFGQRSEGGTRYRWWSELATIAQFADEK